MPRQPRLDVVEAEGRLGRRNRAVVSASPGLWQLAVKGRGDAGAAMARVLRVTTVSLNRLAVSADLPDRKKYLTAL